MGSYPCWGLDRWSTGPTASADLLGYYTLARAYSSASRPPSRQYRAAGSVEPGYAMLVPSHLQGCSRLVAALYVTPDLGDSRTLGPARGPRDFAVERRYRAVSRGRARYSCVREGLGC